MRAAPRLRQTSGVGKDDRQKTPPPPPAGPFHNPFAGLAGKLGPLPAGPAPRTEPERKQEPAGPARAVVRMERKGRGGKRNEQRCDHPFHEASPLGPHLATSGDAS